MVASAAEEKAGTDGRMALTGGGGGLGTARVLAPPNHDDALPFRGGQAPRQRASYLDPSQLFQLEEDFLLFGCNEKVLRVATPGLRSIWWGGKLTTQSQRF